MSRYKILTPNGFRSFYKVDKKIGDVIKIWLVDKQIECSTDHRFMEDGKEIVASTLKIGDKLGGYTIEKIEKLGKKEVYSPIEVDGYEYISKGIVSHNCEFIGSSLTLVDGQSLAKLRSRPHIKEMYGYSLRIYEDPIPGALYVMGVDSSTGVGNDSCTIQVLKINSSSSFEEVAVFTDNKIKPEIFASRIAEISYMYNDALMILENNDVGKIVAETLWYDIGCGNVINTDRNGIGTRATPATKLSAIMMLKRAIENEKLKIYDEETINQLSRFEEVAPNVFKGAKNQHDDLVSSLYWAVYCLNQPQIDLDSVRPIKVSVEEEYAPPPVMFDESNDNSDFWRSFN